MCFIYFDCFLISECCVHKMWRCCFGTRSFAGNEQNKVNKTCRLHQCRLNTIRKHLHNSMLSITVMKQSYLVSSVRRAYVLTILFWAEMEILNLLSFRIRKFILKLVKYLLLFKCKIIWNCAIDSFEVLCSSSEGWDHGFGWISVFLFLLFDQTEENGKMVSLSLKLFYGGAGCIVGPVKLFLLVFRDCKYCKQLHLYFVQRLSRTFLNWSLSSW